MENVIININDACDKNCIGCYVPKQTKFMELEDYKKIIDKLPPQVKHVVISGGEPFLHKELLEMVKYTSEKLCKPSIVTSGTFKELEPYKKYLQGIFVTIKYPDKRFDNLWKRKEDAHEMAVNVLKQAKDLHIASAINFIADTENYKYLYKMVDFADKYGADLEVGRYLPYTREAMNIILSDKEWEELCGYAKQKKINIIFPNTYDKNYHSQQKCCIAGINRLNVHVDGSVTGCIYLTKGNIVGNLIEETYTQIEKRLEDWRYEYKDVVGCVALKQLLKDLE